MTSRRNRQDSNGTTDRRVQRTRGALLGAFGELVLQRPYGDIRVADIIENAKVGRLREWLIGGGCDPRPLAAALSRSCQSAAAALMR